MAGREYGNASGFFASLQRRAKHIADEEAQKMADSMTYVLRHRQKLKGGNGQWPRWHGTEGKRSKRSFDNWAVKPAKNGEYWITNNSHGTNGYNYTFNLSNGNHWPKSFYSKHGPFKRLIRKNGKIFSTQLPNGLEPWLKIKRDEFEANMAKRFIKEL